MIERHTIDGREATVAYFDAQFNPVDPYAVPDHLAKVLFDDGNMLILRSPRPKLRDAEWDEGKHPRDKEGQFAESGGGQQPVSPDDKKSKLKKDFSDKANTFNLMPESSDIMSSHLAEKDLSADDFINGMFPVNHGALTFYTNNPGDPANVMVESGLQDANGRDIGVLRRGIDFDHGYAHHEIFTLRDGSQGVGVAKTVLASQIALYQKLGIHTVSLHANIDVGGYAWAKYGFAPKYTDWMQLRQTIKDKLSFMIFDLTVGEANGLSKLVASDDPKAIWAIADSWHGKKLLIKTQWEGELNLKDEASMRRFNAYVNKKKEQ